MKQEIKIIISLVGTIIFGVIANVNSSGAKTSGHYMGLVMVSIIVFFVINWLLGKINDTEYIKEIQDQKELRSKVENDLNNYQELKNSFNYFSDERLLAIYKKFQLEHIENLERLALEEELVKRRLIKNSPMHEKLYSIKNKNNEPPTTYL
jgi:hypothetical protein